MSLSEAAQAYLEGEPTPVSAKRLEGADSTALEALVNALEAAHLRGHLEILGRTKIAKAARKAARKAAHRLSCAGVSGEKVRSSGLDFTVDTPLETVALVSAPGFRAQTWMAFSGIQGGPPVELICKEGPVIEKLNALPRLSIGKIRQAMRDVRDEHTMALPVLADAHLAVRLIDRVAADFKGLGTDLPPSWQHLSTWCEAAIKLGANPDQASAAKRLGPDITVPEDGAVELLDIPESGVMMPPTAQCEPLFRKLGMLVQSSESHTEDSFMSEIDTLVDELLETWLGDSGERAKLSLRLETIADVLLHADKEGAARKALWAQKALEDPAPQNIPLFRASVERIIARDSAYAHYTTQVQNTEDAAT